MLSLASLSSPPSMWKDPWCGETAAYEAAASSLLGRGGECSSRTFPASSLLGRRLTIRDPSTYPAAKRGKQDFARIAVHSYFISASHNA